jgi:hypothetical protein
MSCAELHEGLRSQDQQHEWIAQTNNTKNTPGVLETRGGGERGRQKMQLPQTSSRLTSGSPQYVTLVPACSVVCGSLDYKIGIKYSHLLKHMKVTLLIINSDTVSSNVRLTGQLFCFIFREAPVRNLGPALGYLDWSYFKGFLSPSR